MDQDTAWLVICMHISHCPLPIFCDLWQVCRSRAEACTGRICREANIGIELAVARPALAGSMAQSDVFVSVSPDGRTFTRGGTPFHFCGANCYYMLVRFEKSPSQIRYLYEDACMRSDSRMSSVVPECVSACASKAAQKTSR